MIILGSASPRRKELFEKLGVPFNIVAVDVDESIDENLEPIDVACSIAHKKMEAIREKITSKDTLCVTADTIVVYGNNILGKPKDRKEAFAMISSLSGESHFVITAVCSDYSAHRHTFYEKTKVWFSPMNEEDIDKYLQANDFSDKAGGYGIQGAAGFLIEKIEGDYYNVVGFPMNRFLREFRSVYGKDICSI